MKFLVLDDELIIMLILGDILKDLGHESVRVNTAEEALEHLNEVEAAFVDVRLDQGTSLPVVDQLVKERKSFTFICGNLDDIPPQYRHNLKMQKPFTSANVETAVRSMTCYI